MLWLSRQVLPVLQLTRMALVFTAIADSSASLLIWWRKANPETIWTLDEFIGDVRPHRLVAVLLVSVGLYGFGMSLNDIIDRRRDESLASHRPLPSGRIGVVAAHIICVLLGLSAVGGGMILAGEFRNGVLSLGLVVWTILLIVFYDFAGKYLVGLGLLTLGMVRFFHAAIPAPQLPLAWHPLLLLNHVAILSALAYRWESKRPPLTRGHWATVIGGVLFINLVTVTLVAWRRGTAGLWITGGLAWPILAACAFLAAAILIRGRSGNRRRTGQQVMLMGLLWLIVYDAAFVLGYVGWRPAVLVAGMLPLSWLSVQFMRWWARFLSIPTRPEFRKV